jgi:cell division septation protein DedD
MVTAANTAPVRLTPGAMDGNAEDASSYLVQVGTFRVEAHARELATRLAAAGYSATVSTREEGDRELHVVRVGRFAGRQAAEHVAARIGDAEQLVASIVATPGRN